jgi:hypothetical protein
MHCEEFRKPRDDLAGAVDDGKRKPDQAAQRIAATGCVLGILDACENFPRAVEKQCARAGERYARVVRSKSVTPRRFSRSPMIRETDGCDRPSSLAAREKLPPSAARIKTVNCCSRSLI